MPESIFKTALKCRCPACGEGELFETLLGIKETCEVCNTDLRGHDSGDGPLFFVMFFLCFVVVLGALYVELAFEPALWVHLVVWPLFVFGGSLLMLRPTKALMVAYQYKLLGTKDK